MKRTCRLISFPCFYALTLSKNFSCCVYWSLLMDEKDEFCCFAYSTAQDDGKDSAALRFNDFRTRCDFVVRWFFLILLWPSSNHDIGGFGKDWGDGDSKHLLAAKNEKFGGEHDPQARLLFVCPKLLGEWFLFGVLMLIDFEGVGRCCCDPLVDDFLLLGLTLTKVRSFVEGELLLLVPISIFS